jgi:tryptophan synthase alpha chain
MNRIEKKFKDLRSVGKKAFIAFITAGYPSLDITGRLIREFERVGVDIIELGVPFTDPLADGPIIQDASREALQKGVTLKKIMHLVARIRKQSAVPICLMTYYNPIFCYKEESFVRDAVRCGIDGVIIPDLPPDEGKDFSRKAREYGLDVIAFVSPTTNTSRARYIVKVARGFIYYVSLTGVTGPRQALPSDLVRNVRRIKSLTDKPVCVGFGISTPLQVKQIGGIADGVIVGSAIVRKIREEKGASHLVPKVSQFVSYLKRGI